MTELPRKASFICTLVDSGVNWRAIPELAKEAAVEPELIFEMISGDPVSIYEARKVLAALSARTGVDYAVDTLNINVCREADVHPLAINQAAVDMASEVIRRVGKAVKEGTLDVEGLGDVEES
jgi:hypothetical protein